MEINDLFDDRTCNFRKVAKRSGLHYNTITNVRKDPEKSKVSTLRALAEAMGYKLILSLEKIEDK